MRLKQKLPRQKKRSHRTNAFLYCVRLGFFAGLFWGSFRWLMYVIHFTKVIPAFLAEPFFRTNFLVTAWGHVIGIVFFIIFSMAAALLYKLLLGRMTGPRAGIAYGMLWWAVLFVGIGPLLKMMAPLNKLGLDTVISEFCLFLVWGLFIGFTIAFEFTDEMSREPMDAQGAK
ncbi:hypothetical protein PAECIP111893_03161 [Paenibacillus plantiphilus]|uniref:Uncharacterized protein n=1 Tax=Paenibacillus plantiphilus TaxID=2905650 RepID=A0ABN8GNN2_9BACL|nr:YqhR family membrane protein [Paenibacillus plantiphilus]CAH1210190.1 hypothetical protein PAECIP111893_03161 [Paenibacillus plantiphilus]